MSLLQKDLWPRLNKIGGIKYSSGFSGCSDCQSIAITTSKFPRDSWLFQDNELPVGYVKEVGFVQNTLE